MNRALPEQPRPFIHAGAPKRINRHNIRDLEITGTGKWKPIRITTPTILIPAARVEAPIYISPFNAEQPGDLNTKLWCPRGRMVLDTPIGEETEWFYNYDGSTPLKVLQVDVANALIAAQLASMPGFRPTMAKVTAPINGANGQELVNNDFRRTGLRITNMDGTNALRFQVATASGALVGAAYGGAYGIVKPGDYVDITEPFSPGYNVVVWSDHASSTIQCSALSVY